MKGLNLILLSFAITFASCSETKNKAENMEKKLQEISPRDITDNVVKLIGDDWMLITSGNKNNFNMMTASWGGIGHLWNQPVVFVFVRPQRYTYEFMEENDYFTLTFFDEKYRDILNYCGTISGRDENKAEKTGLLPIETELGNIYFGQSRLVIECKKIYYDDIKEQSFLDSSIIENFYPEKDFHRVYVGKIVKVIIEN